MSKSLTYELVGLREVVYTEGEFKGQKFYQCCFICENPEFVGIYVEKGTVHSDNITCFNDSATFGLNCKCKIIWEKNSYKIQELFVIG